MEPDGTTSWPLLGALLDLLYPPTCGLCSVRLHPIEQTICDPCRQAMLTEYIWRCRHCGASGTDDPPRRGEKCPYCPDPGDLYRGVLAAVDYHDASGRCVHRFKYHRRMEMGELMGRVMVARLTEPLRVLGDRACWIVPVPLHWGRRWQRGFNQSQLLAHRLAESLVWPMHPEVLRRIKATRRQVTLPKERRPDNVRGAFRASLPADMECQGILLVDDVVTTGSTIAECARVLIAAGAPQVWAASFARARRTND